MHEENARVDAKVPSLWQALPPRSPFAHGCNEGGDLSGGQAPLPGGVDGGRGTSTGGGTAQHHLHRCCHGRHGRRGGGFAGGEHHRRGKG